MRTNTGAIQISRSLYDSEIWRKPSDWLKIWIYILGNVNYKDNNDFLRGENFFRYEIISLECSVSYNTVVKCMKYLKSARQVQVRKTTRGAIISVIKYDEYQDLSNYGNTEATEKQDKSNRSTNTIIEERKKGRKKETIIHSIDETSKEVCIQKKQGEVFKKLIEDSMDLNFFMNKYEITKQETLYRLEKFYGHWTEKSPRGKKERWEKEKTFDVVRRFHKWNQNKRDWKRENFNSKPSGICKLD